MESYHISADPIADLSPSVRPRRRLSNGDANKLCIEDRPAHDWYRFVLSFPPHLVREYLDRFGVTGAHTVLDPFCGTGTTLVECKKHGIPSVGIEANPMAHFASKVKTDWSPDPDGLADHARAIADMAAERLGESQVREDPLLCLEEQARYEALRKLPDEQMTILLTDSISPLPLHKTLVLRDCIEERSDPRYHDHEMLALAKALVFSISNLEFGPEVGVGPRKRDAAVVSSWLTAVLAIADDLRILNRTASAPAEAYCSDSRRIGRLLEDGSIDAVITSPPYPNEKDYTRTTRLESVLLGFIGSKAELRALKQGLVRSNTRNVYKGDDDDEMIADHPEIMRIANAIEARRIELGKTSGFERMYSRVAKLYFGGMAKHLADLRSALRPGARLAYVVGDQASYLRIMIRTGRILGDIAESLGYQVESTDLFRTRLATATREQLREEVVVLRWAGRE